MSDKNTKEDIKTRFQVGNELWRRVDPDNIGRKPKYETSKELWRAISGYFNHCDLNPWESKEIKLTQAEEKTDKNTKEDIKTVWKRVPYTWKGLYIYLSVCNLDHYKTKPEFSELLKITDDIIYTQKFTGATTGDFNHNIIARDLGLRDNHNLNLGGQSDNPIEITKIQIPDNNRNKVDV